MPGWNNAAHGIVLFNTLLIGLLSEFVYLSISDVRVTLLLSYYLSPFVTRHSAIEVGRDLYTLVTNLRRRQRATTTTKTIILPIAGGQYSVAILSFF